MGSLGRRDRDRLPSGGDQRGMKAGTSCATAALELVILNEVYFEQLSISSLSSATH